MSNVTRLPSHVQLMLLATLRQPDVASVTRIRELAAAVHDWESFLEVTLHQRVAPLVYENLDRIRPSGIPAFVFEQLYGDATANAFAALSAMRDIDRMGKRFEQAGMELSVLKGVPLSQTLFGKPNTRHVGDIDLLTTPDHLLEKLELLAEFGYRRINPRVRLTPQRLSTYTAFRKDFTCRNPDTGQDIDLHWRLFDNRHHAGNQILNHATYRTVDVYGMSARSFSLQDQFLYVASHGVSDAWMYMKSLSDVGAFLSLLTPQELDDALLRAQNLGVLTQVSAAVHGANEWLGLNIVNDRLLSADDALIQYIRRRFLKLMTRHDFHPNRTHLSTIDWLQLEMKLAPGARSFAEILGHVIWRPRAWSTVDLPDHLFWMYPLIGLVLPPRRHSLDY